MRSFSKKLAFVLAAAMVFTAFAPAAKAEAAAMKINKSSKILYVTDGEGINDAAQVGGGKGNVAEYDFSVSNKPKDYKKTYTFDWSSSDEDVIEVGKAGLTKAVGVGVANVVCVVTEKATGKATTLKSEVTVKANAAEVVITNADDYADLAYEVGAEIDLNRAMYDAEGNKAPKRGVKVTDYTRWMVEPSAGVKVTQSNGKYVFTDAAEAGTYKLWCETYQSSKYQKATAKSQVIEVELVKEKTFEVDQTASNKFDILLDEEANLVISDVVVSRLIKVGSSVEKIPAVVSGVTMSEDKKTASVSVFTNFVNGVDYEVAVKGYDEAATMTAFVGKPTTMTISSDSKRGNGVFITPNNSTKLTYRLFDEKGNDVTNTVNNPVVNFSAANSVTGDYYVSGDSICIYKENIEVAVNAEFYTGQYDDNSRPITIKANATFISVAADAISVAEVTLNIKEDGGTAAGFKSAGGTYSDCKVPLGDGSAALELKIKTTKSGDYSQTYTAGAYVTPLDAVNGAKPYVSFRTSNPDVFAVNGNVITLFKEGTAAVLVDLVTVDGNGNLVYNTIAAKYVTVVAKRASASLTVENGGRAVVGTATGFTTTKLALTAKDQYGTVAQLNLTNDTNGLSGEKFADNSAIPDGAVSLTNEYGQDKIVFNGAALASKIPAGKNEVTLHIVAKVKTQDGKEFPVNFVVTVKNPSGNAYVAVEAGGTTSGNVGRYDTPNDGNNNTEKQKTAEFKVFNMKNGIKVEQLTPVAKPSTVTGTTTSNYYYTVTRNGADITALTTIAGDGTVKLDYSAATTAIPTGATTNGVIVEYKASYKDLGAGTYVFTLYKVVTNNSNQPQSFAFVGSATASVTCDTESYTLVKRTSENVTHGAYTYTGTVTDNASQLAMRDCFEINGRNGQKTTNGKFFVKATDAPGYVYVESITFYEKVDNGLDGAADTADDVFAPYTVNINVSLKK